MADNTPLSNLPPSQIDRNITKLAQAIESLYGGPWGIIWRNFLAGFSRVFGMIFGYAVLLAIITVLVLKTGLWGQAQNFWKTITQGLITDVQKNFQRSLPQLQLPLNQNPANQVKPEQTSPSAIILK